MLATRTEQFVPVVEMDDGTTYGFKVERLFPSNQVSTPNQDGR